ncbi:MAG: LptF/LptG family permease [Phycisphaerae bacterium]
MTLRIHWTLQRYILKEMTKTCVLAALAIGGVFGLGGGVVHMIELGDVTPNQLMRLMLLVVPVAGALTLPIAVMFAATSTYGRLSADNEFVACRSGGINIHGLLLPSVVLSLISASITFGAINYVIPGMVRNLNALIVADIPRFIEQRLHRPRGMTLGGNYRIYADNTSIDASDPDAITLRRVAFVELDGDEWVRFGTARAVRLELTRDRAATPPAGTGAAAETPRSAIDAVAGIRTELFGLSCFDRRADYFWDLERQRIGKDKLPPTLPLDVKFLTLGRLFHYRAHPEAWRDVVQRIAALRIAVGTRMIYDRIADAYQRDGRITLADGDVTLRIDAAGAARRPRDGSIELTDATLEQTAHGRTNRYHAVRALIGVTRGNTPSDCTLKVDLYDARLVGGTGREPPGKVTAGPVQIARDLLDRIDALSHDELLRASAGAAQGTAVAKHRAAAVETRDRTVRRITAAIHERLAYSISVFGLVCLGAALGIRFKGAHVVTAFGLSFVPALCVIILIVTGRQMAQNASTHGLGLGMMWSGIVAVALLDLFVLARVVRR